MDRTTIVLTALRLGSTLTAVGVEPRPALPTLGPICTGSAAIDLALLRAAIEKYSNDDEPLFIPT